MGDKNVRGDISPTLPVFDTTAKGDLGGISIKSFAPENSTPWVIARRCLCDPAFSRLIDLRPVIDKLIDTGQ